MIKEIVKTVERLEDLTKRFDIGVVCLMINLSPDGEEYRSQELEAVERNIDLVMNVMQYGLPTNVKNRLQVLLDQYYGWYEQIENA